MFSVSMGNPFNQIERLRRFVNARHRARTEIECQNTYALGVYSVILVPCSPSPPIKPF